MRCWPKQTCRMVSPVSCTKETRACSTPVTGDSFDSSPKREKIGLPAELRMKTCLRCAAHSGVLGSSSS
eukprot:2008425-Prymnesium_polylepis.1